MVKQQKENNILLAGIFFASLWWISSVVFDVFVFAKKTFAEAMFPSDEYELWTRILVVFLILIFSFYAYLFQRRERKVREDLNVSEERYRTLFEQAADSIVLIEPATGKIIDFNRQAYETLGYSREEFQSFKAPDLEIVESPVEYMRHIEEVSAKGGGVFETKHKRKDGKVLDIFINSKVVSIKGKDYIQGIWRDITQRKVAEQKITHLYRVLNDIFDRAPIGIYVVNDQGNIDYVNPAMLKLSGIDYNQTKTINLFELDSYEKIGLTEKIKYALKGKGFFLKEIEYTSYFGKKRSIRNFHGMPLEENGKDKVLIFVVDVTEQKDIEIELMRMNEELNRMTELKSEFVSTVSHELRTPLAITKEGVSLIIDEILGKVNDEQKKILIVARDNVDRLGRLIDSLLDVSKIESGKVELKKELLNLVDLAKEIVYSFSIKIKEKNLELKTDFSSEKIEAYCDRDKIEQIFTNLIANAIKFTEQGSIEVSIKEKGDQIECAVTDSGVGISAEDLPRVFARFQQIGRTYGPGEKGTGLGLSITKALVEMHQGDIWVESELAKGTKFSFTLPKRPATFKELIIDNLKGVMKSYPTFSLIVASVNDFEQVRQQLSEKRIDAALKGTKHALESKLPRNDIILNDADKLVIVLVDCGKENIVKAEKRIKKTAQEYLAQEGFADKIKFNFGYATYPQDASTDEELIEKAQNM